MLQRKVMYIYNRQTITNNFVKRDSGDAGDRTRGLSHAKRTLYRWATSPSLHTYQQHSSLLESLTFHDRTTSENHNLIAGSVAERSKALVLGTSLLGGVGSNPTTAKHFSKWNHSTYFSQLSHFQILLPIYPAKKHEKNIMLSCTKSLIKFDFN